MSSSLERIWNVWNIRGFMILSLCMQLLLAAAAPFRKRSSNGLTTFVVWSAYFLADWVSIFAFGLITNSGCRSPSGKPEVNVDVLALWAGFLLMHLGGSDTITAFSLEDNALWLRHFVSLITMIVAFFNIFAKTLPGKNSMLVPTMMVFLAGVVKYGERTRALYLASLETMKKSFEDSPAESGLNNENVLHSKSAFKLFKILQGLVVDVMPSYNVARDTREFFKTKHPFVAFEVLTREMSFLYDALYTKTLAVHSTWGVIFRNITFYSLIIALVLFGLSEKQGLQGVDVGITYVLVAGVLALDMVSGMMFLLSHTWTEGMDLAYLGALHICAQGFIPLAGSIMCVFVDACFLRGIMLRLWSETIGGFNLLTYCLEESSERGCRKCYDTLGLMTEKLGISDAVAWIRYATRNPFDWEIWEFAFEELHKKTLLVESDVSRTREIYEARGDLTLRTHNCDDLLHFTKDFEFDNTLLTWHIATQICVCLCEEDTNAVIDHERRRFGQVVSNYMLYLLIMRPKMMSPVAGIGHVRYHNTCAEAKRLGRSSTPVDMKGFCRSIMEQNDNNIEPLQGSQGERGRSVLLESCSLAKILMKKENKWEIISGVWMELLCFAAGHCRVDSHARVLAEGGEFISFVWLLMTHLGIVPHVPTE